MPAPNPNPPANRAARRAQRKDTPPSAPMPDLAGSDGVARYRDPAATRPGRTHVQPQGRRIAPVRRTG